MKSIGALLCLGQAAAVIAAEGGARPRGVGPNFAKYYKDAEKFTCISNPSIVIPFSRVNDDYCDCPDGSDEPGTSACANLSPGSPHTPADRVKGSVDTNLSLPGFYCKNKGHIPSYVPFTSVNDGVCDYELCCDGSEEYANVGGVKCEDKCKELGKEWKKQDEARQKSLGNASRKRRELVTEAGRLRKEVDDRLQSLLTELEGGELKVQQLEQELADIEKREKGKVVRGTVSPKAGKLGLLSGLAKQRTNELREQLLRVKEERDAVRGRLEEVEEILSTFKVEYNPNFNDEGVKRAVRAWDDYAARDKSGDVDQPRDRDLDEISKSDEDNGLNWADYEDDEEGSETDVLYEFENYLPPSLRTWVDQKLRDLRVTLIENGILAETSTASGGESRAVSDARARLDAARKSRDGTQSSIKGHREDLEQNFGPADVFRALKGQCVSTDSGEYTYEVCFMEKTTQKPKKGGGHTNMGSYSSIDSMMIDEELPASGKGLGSGERVVMKYTNGQQCWNGPKRSTSVIMACSEENEIWKVFEEEKCVYRVEMGTPSVCELEEAAKGAPARDEL